MKRGGRGKALGERGATTGRAESKKEGEGSREKGTGGRSKKASKGRRGVKASEGGRGTEKREGMSERFGSLS